MILVSACLAGMKSTFKNKSKTNKKVVRLVKEGKAIPICPEQLGGLSTPRSGARIITGNGEDVLDNKSKVMTDDGTDVTNQYLQGAYETLKIVRRFDANTIITLQGSPSCGNERTQGGEKVRKRTKGDGVTVALLKRNGIKVLTQKDLNDKIFDEISK